MNMSCQTLVEIITPLYRLVLVSVLIAAGVLMMLARPKAVELLKNVGISVVVFTVAMMLLQSFCSDH